MVDDVARYLRAHRGVRYLHLWLSDGSNNQCECELCRSTRPADFYVMLIVAAFAMWNMGVAFLVGVVLDNSLRRGWLKL